MVLLNDAVYLETKNIALGITTKPPLVHELSSWFMETYSVNMLNIHLDYFPSSPKSYKLKIIVRTTEDYQKLQIIDPRPQPSLEEQISAKFKQLALKYKYARDFQLENLFIAYSDFSDQAKTDANWQAESENKETIAQKYPAVWRIEARFSGSVVFYYTDADILTNENNGVSELIRNDYYLILKKYDVLDYFTRDNISLDFNSKENLDKNYEGNLFYFSR